MNGEKKLSVAIFDGSNKYIDWTNSTESHMLVLSGVVLCRKKLQKLWEDGMEEIKK